MAQLVDRDETPHRLPLSLDTLIITSLRSGGYRPAGKGLSPRTRFKVTQMSRGEGCVKNLLSCDAKPSPLLPSGGLQYRKEKEKFTVRAQNGSLFILFNRYKNTMQTMNRKPEYLCL